jgi:hypothetical protein
MQLFPALQLPGQSDRADINVPKQSNVVLISDVVWFPEQTGHWMPVESLVRLADSVSLLRSLSSPIPRARDITRRWPITISAHNRTAAHHRTLIGTPS